MGFMDINNKNKIHYIMKMIKLFEAWSQVNEEVIYPNPGLDFRPYMCEPQKNTGPLGRVGDGLHNYELIQWNLNLPKRYLEKGNATGTPIMQVPPQLFGAPGRPATSRTIPWSTDKDNFSTKELTAWVINAGGQARRLAGAGEIEDYMKDPSSLDADSPYNKNTNEYDAIYKKNKTNKQKTTAPIGVEPSLLTKIQMRLRELGGSYAASLGNTGPGKDGVDGKWGQSTAASINLALDALGSAVPSMQQKTIPLNLITGDDTEIDGQNEQPA